MRVSGLLVASAALVMLVGCSGPSAGVLPTAGSTSSASATEKPTVVAISIDGLNPEAITSLGRSGVPHLWRLIDEGASTFNARTAFESTSTLPNHTGMITGRRVVGAGGTSVTFNNDNGSTLASVHGSYVPSMFDIAHDAGLTTALFAEKDKFRFLVRSFDNNHGAEDVTGADDGRDKIDFAAIEPSDELVEDVTDAVVDQAADLVFWHIAAPDAAGHATGWLSTAYLAAVKDADDQIGQLLAALDESPELAARTTILLTADHGGVEGAQKHTDSEALADYRIGFIAWGHGVAAGVDLYDLNRDLADPGTSRPNYAGPQPVRNLDLADTALRLLGLPDLSDVSDGIVLQGP